MKKQKDGKELAYILRHNPESVEGTLDNAGWMSVSTLLSHGWTKELLEEIVSSDDKGRYEFSQDHKRIRALQGHSVKGIKADYVEWAGPMVVYHGTQSKSLQSIMREGIKPGSREYVHFSQDIETARKVALRRGPKIVILVVDISDLGAVVSKNGVILVQGVVPSVRIMEAIWEE